MLSERLIDSFTLFKLQSAIADAGLFNVALTLLAVVVTAIAVDYAHMLYLRSKMPPGPFPWPIVGNTFSLPDSKPWLHFEALSKKYNTPLITFWIGRLVLLVWDRDDHSLTYPFVTGTLQSGSTMPGALTISWKRRPRSTHRGPVWLCLAS